MNPILDENGGVHPIILNNMIAEKHCFTKNGNYIHGFSGIDGNFYYAVVPSEKWPPCIWELYEKEGITVDGPTPVEEIKFPERNVEED